MEIKDLENFFKIFPGVGPRTAKRYVRVYLSLPQKKREELLKVISYFSQGDFFCPECFNFSNNSSLCPICTDLERDDSLLCIVEKVEDLETIEKSGIYKGLYYVLGSLLSLDDSQNKDFSFRVKKLEERIKKRKIKEIVFSFKLSVEGKITLNYLKEKLLQLFPYLKFSTLNFGIPASLDINMLDFPSLVEGFKNKKEI